MTDSSQPINVEELMEEHYHEIFHYIRKQTQNTEDAKDLVQDVFMKVFEKQHTYNPSKASKRTWLYRIAHNHVINFFKKAENAKRAKVSPEMFEQFASSEDILAALIQDEDISIVITLMHKVLNRKHLKIMNLYFFSELPVKAIAKTLTIPEKTVYNTINRSIKKIKNEMEVLNNG